LPESQEPTQSRPPLAANGSDAAGEETAAESAEQGRMNADEESIRSPEIENPIAAAESLTKRFPTGDEELEVLSSLSMRVERGEVVAVVGKSGTGKSTLLHLLGALDRPTEGTVRFRGEDLFEKDDEALAAFRNREVGFVFQFHHLLPEFTALENAAMPALIQQQSLAEAKPRAMELLEALGIAARSEHQPAALSGGEKQRVAVARALMNSPALVLADEPTGNLDTKTAGALHDRMLRLSRERGQTFVLVTHNLTLAGRADRTLYLREGRLYDEAAERGEGRGSQV
jgi:lipoprotein-releasing system ATP-binding protein